MSDPNPNPNRNRNRNPNPNPNRNPNPNPNHASVIVLAATVGLPLWLSVLSDSGGLLVVLANSLWPLTWRVGAAAQPGARARSI